MKGLFKVANKAIDLVDKVLPDNEKTRELKAEIIKLDVNSDSKYLKNARPSIIYLGLLLVLFEYLGLRGFLINLYYSDRAMVIDAMTSSEKILEFFLVTWGSVATAYVISRSGEKKNRKILK